MHAVIAILEKIAEDTSTNEDVGDTLSKLDPDAFNTDDKLDLRTFGAEKLESFLLYLLLGKINSRLDNLVDRFGASAVESIFDFSLGYGPLDTILVPFVKDNIKYLQKVLSVPAEAELGIEFLNDLDQWERFLICIGLSPEYANELERVFGSDGLESMNLLLESLLAGRLSENTIVKMIQNYE